MAADWAAIESKWQERWRESRAFEAEPDGRPKRFVTVAYPYPNSPQHVGHGRTYTLADVHARFYRMRGYNVLFPMGFHYTGTPVLGMARRIAAGEPEILAGLRDVYGVPEEVIGTFTEPVRIADYFREEIRSGMIEMGYSIDWRREFTTIDPGYQRFVEWQISTLRDRGRIIRGSHPVGWCPVDQNPVSQHDTMGDVEPKIDRNNCLVRFRIGGAVLPVATLRPETVFGVTNLWADPGATYKRATVGGEEWIVSEKCAERLGFLGKEVSVTGDVAGSDLVGMTAAGHDGREVPVLPAEFVDPATGTGLVMSVPAHAPKDYQALEDLKRSGDAAASAIEPVTMIETDGYGAVPAADVVGRLGVSGQSDERLEEATRELYAREFADGTLGAGCGRFSGEAVRTARDGIRDWLAESGVLEPFPVLENAPVRCRCGAECVVRMLDGQWFLDYGDEGWKESARACLESMDILPANIRTEFAEVIDWLHERACARQQGLGTRLPWDPDWIVESLSDSVIYMAYYAISRFVGDGTVAPGDLTRGLLDHVFLGREAPGSAPPAAADMRREFEYFYPVDSRHSGRDLVQNHLSFFILNHVAVFGEPMWPRGIVVNGSVLMDGAKMSKSMGNIIPLRAAVREHGADPVRLAIISSAELLQDADFDVESVSGARKKLESMLDECAGGDGPAGPGDGAEDRWLLSRWMIRTGEVTEAVGKMRLREALQGILYGFDADLGWYRRRAEAKGRSGAVPGVIRAQRTAMLSPFAPHAADEMWERMGMEGTASGSPWPEYSEEAVDWGSVHAEELLKGTMDDIARILKVSGMTPGRITVYVSSDAAKSGIYRKILGAVAGGKSGMGEIMRGLIADPETASAKRMPDYVQRVVRDLHSETAEVRRARLAAGGFDEAGFLAAELPAIAQKEFGARVEVCSAGDPGIYDPRGKARHARPFKPAILIE